MLKRFPPLAILRNMILDIILKRLTLILVLIVEFDDDLNNGVSVCLQAFMDLIQSMGQRIISVLKFSTSS
jgi:hypothetical protein